MLIEWNNISDLTPFLQKNKGMLVRGRRGRLVKRQWIFHLGHVYANSFDPAISLYLQRIMS
jgi:hypothetical protein